MQPHIPADKSTQISDGTPAQIEINDSAVHETADNEDDANLKYKLHPDNPGNFLKLCCMLRLLMRHTVSDDDVNRADTLICEYCTELIWVREFSVL